MPFYWVLLITLLTCIYGIIMAREPWHAPKFSKLQSKAKQQNNHVIFCISHSVISKILISWLDKLSIRNQYDLHWGKVQCESKRDLDLPVLITKCFNLIKINYQSFIIITIGLRHIPILCWALDWKLHASYFIICECAKILDQFFREGT